VQHVSALQQLLPQYQLGIVVVNDASQKNVNAEHISYLQQHLKDFQYISYTENKGKGYALREGMKNLHERLILYTDIDFPYEYASMVKILETLAAGKDIAIGTRDSGYYENTPQRRKWISKVVRFVFTMVFKLPITDTQCGLKGFNQRGKAVFMKTTIHRFLFDMEFIAIAAKTKGIQMEPVFVTLRKNVVFSRMNMNILMHEMSNFLKILRISRRQKPYTIE